MSASWRSWAARRTWSSSASSRSCGASTAPTSPRRLHLAKFPTEAPWVMCGPGENAGVVDIGDGLVAVFKMESHNHPSFIEPYQGAATGVGGILRDVFTMGARPVAHPRRAALRRARPPEDPPPGGRRGRRHRRLRQLRGRADGRRRVHVPPQLQRQHSGQRDVRRHRRGGPHLLCRAPAGIGNPGGLCRRQDRAATASTAPRWRRPSSATRQRGQAPDRPGGRPFTEKLLIEACLELMAKDCIVAIQDMGAAGPHLVLVRDGGARRRRHRARPRPRCRCARAA